MLSAFGSSGVLGSPGTPGVTAGPVHLDQRSVLPHSRLRKKLFGSEWERPKLQDVRWLRDALMEADADASGRLLGPDLVAALRSLQPLEGEPDEVRVAGGERTSD